MLELLRSFCDLIYFKAFYSEGSWSIHEQDLSAWLQGMLEICHIRCMLLEIRWIGGGMDSFFDDELSFYYIEKVNALFIDKLEVAQWILVLHVHDEDAIYLFLLN